MSEKLKVGDRVRLTYVGTVKSVYDGGGVAVIDGQGASPTFAWSDDAVESVEVLVPALKRGTIVKSDSTGYVWHALGGNKLLVVNTVSGRTFEMVSDGLASEVHRGLHTVLHEPTT